MQRKKYSQEFKEQIIKEAVETGNSSIVARRHDLSSSMVSRWVRQFKNGNQAKQNTNNNQGWPFNDITRENSELTKENEQLKKILGDKDLEIEILKDLIKKGNPHLLKKLM